MPRMKQTSYQLEVAARDAVESSKKTRANQVVSSSSFESGDREAPLNRQEQQASPVHDSAVNSFLGDENAEQEDSVHAESRDNIINLTAEVIQEESLDEGCKRLQDKFFLLSVPDDFPIRRTFYRPHPRFDTIAKGELGQHELRVVSHFDIVESEDDKGRPRLTLRCRCQTWDIFSAMPPYPMSVYARLTVMTTNNLGCQQTGRELSGSVQTLREESYQAVSKPSYNTLASYCNHASPINPKRKVEAMADEQSKERKLTALETRRGGNTGTSNAKQPNSRAQRKYRETEKQEKPPSPKHADTQDKTVVPSTVLTTKNSAKGVIIQDITHISKSPSPILPNTTSILEIQTRVGATDGSDVSAPGLIYRSNQWIECPEGRLSGEVVKRFSVLVGHSGDRWQPKLDVS
uniref:Uncharacterized protein n=1 Tax=Chenopodium quinoa TaxID=63459 RepID=A0A803NC80_CHEQI